MATCNNADAPHVRLSKRSQPQKSMYCMIPFIESFFKQRLISGDGSQFSGYLWRGESRGSLLGLWCRENRDFGEGVFWLSLAFCCGKDLWPVQKLPGSFCTLYLQPVGGHLRWTWGMTFFSSLWSTLLIGRNLVVDSVSKIPGKTVCL